MESPISSDHYKILNVPKDASLATIRSVYKKLVLTCHPDKFPDEAVKAQKSEEFHQVRQAYEILSDETKRQEYDEAVKLAELRADVMRERGGSRIAPDLGSRSGPSPKFEVRDDGVYEVREPRRYRDEDSFGVKYQEYRASTRKYDDYQAAPSPRKTSGRSFEEKKTKEFDEDREYRVYLRQSAKAADRQAKHGQQKRKDKDKRKDRAAKSTTKFAYSEHYLDDEDESDSDSFERRLPPRSETVSSRRYEDGHGKSKATSPQRNDKQGGNYSTQTIYAEDYIKKSQQDTPIELELRRPASNSRRASTTDVRNSLRKPTTSADTGRRAYTRPHDARKSSPSRLSGRDRRMSEIEIVDPPPSRRPSMPVSSSDPRSLKTMEPSTSRRDYGHSSNLPSVPEAGHPSMRRADTMPMNASNPRRLDTYLANSSKIRSAENQDSGYSSSGTPEQYQGKSPHIRQRSQYYDDNKVLYMEPGEYESDREREHDTFPKSHRRDERPTPSRAPSSARLTRSTSYAYPQERLESPRMPPPFSRTESSARVPLQPRPSPHSKSSLFGEVTYSGTPHVVHQASPIRHDDIKYCHHRSATAGRDTYPCSSFDSHHRPVLSRHATRAVS